MSTMEICEAILSEIQEAEELFRKERKGLTRPQRALA